MSIDEARQVLADLEGKLAAASAREIELATEGRRLAYAAETGNEAAKKAVAKFDQEAFALDRSKKSLGHAILEGRRLLAEEERAAERERLAENAAAAMQLADSMAARGQRIDAAFEVARAELEAFKADLDGLHGLGISHPRGEQFAVLGGRALATSLMGLPLRAERDHLAPRERTSFTSLADGWAAGVRNWAAPFLEKANAEAAE
jgi:hypothetical protein